MRILKNEIARYLAFGFAGGAALVLGTMNFGSTQIANGLIPPAQAASAQ